ncbi:FAD-dependent oxidoreductase [Roseivirga pacifica]|uniref:FAD-dependent oxidoreductase n=1 Tax=Roseivirga pacifica TaxID=1267423 RepID=UPI0020946B19|nr:FAD-dependent oxidoreductase [Roseivirga pacifica]MCO6360383.1 response regulator [Roseivirga pacifica]MCO6368272.1 response regulator [Roseivirga pacifica]MCO6372414.1 response regulator [Roseivirga pacifica]MCO6376472.1 response regulator [Roseivirga pacifica]MCO6378248.1 response regulator [Roseivirga pacifica]
MTRLPIIFVVDDDEQVLAAIRRDLRSEYRSAYRIMSTTSPLEAVEALAELKKKGEDIALFLSDQRMPAMSGVKFLEQAKVHFPNAKRVLLTAYSDIEAAIQAINDVQLDYYLNKPWDPPEEKLYPVLSDLLDEWHISHIPEFKGIRVVGFQYSPKSHEVKNFLSGNLIPYQWMDFYKEPKGKELLELSALDEKSLPVVFFEDGSHVCSPSAAQLGEKLGMRSKATEEMYDVAIIGAGPAGMAAAVYGGSEGLKTLLIEKHAPGGQAGTSSRIENYLGFPKGLSGADLTHRAITQAKRFGIEFLSPKTVTGIETQNHYKKVHLAEGEVINAKAVIITTGVQYRKLDADGIDNFTGAGVYYGSATTEAQACRDKNVYIVGGGNSAGQAAMYLANFAKNVYIVIRKPDLSSSMSQYLIDQINDTENISLVPKSVVHAAHGKEYLECVSVRNLETDEVEQKDAGALLIFIGARPYTSWTGEHILKNPRGFIKTGRDAQLDEDFAKQWKNKREPFLLETSIPGVFAAGDVREGAMNRVASAVGEGAMSIKFVHEYLAEV